MPVHRSRFLFLFLVLLLVLGVVPTQLRGTQVIKETILLSSTLKRNQNIAKKLHRISHKMCEQAAPFQKPRHRARFRFEPRDNFGREIMSSSRVLAGDFKLLLGVLGPVDMPERDHLFRRLLDLTDSLNIFGKRAIRAIRDHNYALYLASAQAVEKEVSELDQLLRHLEIAINRSIQITDKQMEDL